MGTVSFFIPHVGCPVKCSFCNQHSISGSSGLLTPQNVAKELEQAAIQLGSRCSETAIGFFGGSFTAIDKALQDSFLAVAKDAVERYGYDGIRFSTRPDAIDANVMSSLKRYPIVAVELGAQSMDNTVLEANHRGHTAEDTIKAASLIRQAGYKLTLQMMVGLHTDTIIGATDTAREIIQLQPSSVRIYPTIVLKNTELESLYNSGEYAPLKLDETIACCGELLELFGSAGIDVIKLGLHQEQSMVDNMIAGPHHPALRELCEGWVLCKNIAQTLSETGKKEAKVYISSKDYSKVVGHKGYLTKRFAEHGYKLEFLQDKSLEKGGLLIV